MLDQIKGLHHVTSMAGDARQNNHFFTKTLGLRRVKKTVNFDAPDVYHLYYADEFGTPGSVMTYFPFPNIGKGRHGTGAQPRVQPELAVQHPAKEGILLEGGHGLRASNLPGHWLRGEFVAQ